jgi:hypothetical protein
VKGNSALPGWCGILDGLISELAEECPDNKDGVDSVLLAQSTPETHTTQTADKSEVYNE